MPTNTKLERIRLLSREMKSHYHKIKLKNDRRSIFPGNTASLRTAVKIATLPTTFYEKNNPINEKDVIARFFHNKIRKMTFDLSKAIMSYLTFLFLNCE